MPTRYKLNEECLMPSQHNLCKTLQSSAQG